MSSIVNFGNYFLSAADSRKQLELWTCLIDFWHQVMVLILMMMQPAMILKMRELRKEAYISIHYIWRVTGFRLRDAPQEKKRENVGIFPKWGTPPPSPPFWNVMFLRSKRLWFILHFRTLGTFVVPKNVHFWVVLWFVEVGTGDPTPPLKRKIPTLYRFF